MNVSGDEVQLDTQEMSESKTGMEFSTKIKNKAEMKDLRKVYMENYGVSFEFPSYYLNTARFVPHVKGHIVTLAWHIIPRNANQVVQTTWIDGTVDEKTFSTVYNNTGKSIIIKLAKSNGRNGFKTKKEI